MISKRTKYGLKALSYLSKQTAGKPVLISEIATTQNISQKFLESILLDLKKKGFLGSKKGKGGGYYLIKPGDQITMASIFRSLEGPIAWLPCVISSCNYISINLCLAAYITIPTTFLAPIFFIIPDR